MAKDAGVSVSAVSKVLRNAYGVSDVLRSNVEESIGRLGYRPSSAARGMRGKTDTIGVLLVGLDNPFLSKVVSGLNHVLFDAGYKSMFAVGSAQTHIEMPLVESMMDFKMDGLVLIGPRMEQNVLARIATIMPTVTIAEHVPDATQFDTVNSDDRLGAREAVTAMVEAGYEDIAMVSLPTRGNRNTNVWVQREIGYREAMSAAGLTNNIKIHRREERVEYTESDFDDLLLGSKNRSQAYFCWSDIHAIPLLNRARNLGLEVPKDIAIIGYDNSPPAGLPLIGLASVRQSAIELGETAARCILSRIEGRDVAEHHLIIPELVRRSSF